jgi:hypothetical protein
MSPDFIEMAGQTIGNLQVVDYAPSGNHGAHWVVMCLDCKSQQVERGTNLRKAQKRVGWQIVCKGCGK